MSDKKGKGKIKVVIKKKATETKAKIQKSSYVLNFKGVIKYTKYTTNKVNDTFLQDRGINNQGKKSNKPKSNNI